MDARAVLCRWLCERLIVLVVVFDLVCGCVHVRLGSAATATLIAAAVCAIVALILLLLCDSAQQRVRALHAPIWLLIA